jgi:hypothetical protein
LNGLRPLFAPVENWMYRKLRAPAPKPDPRPDPKSGPKPDAKPGSKQDPKP